MVVLLVIKKSVFLFFLNFLLVNEIIFWLLSFLLLLLVIKLLLIFNLYKLIFVICKIIGVLFLLDIDWLCLFFGKLIFMFWLIIGVVVIKISKSISKIFKNGIMLILDLMFLCLWW